MDPALRELTRRGEPGDEVAVILRLRAPGRAPPQARVISTFGDIVTARVLREAINDVWSDDTTVSVKAPRDYAAELESWQPLAEGHQVIHRPRRPAVRETGCDVIVGAIDWGCDVRHPDLRHRDGRTRLLALWDQRPAAPGLAEPFGYGRIHHAAQIDLALRSPDPYAALDYHPADFDPGFGAHGTHTLSIAAGNGRAGGPAGMAPEANLIFVNMGRVAGGVVARPLGDSTELLEGIDFIVRRIAAGRRCVVNLSLGRHAGEHTGRSLVERAMDQLLALTPGLAIVQSCGNYYQRRTHASFQLRPGEVRRFTVQIDPRDRTTNEVDIWYPGRDTLTVEFGPADGTPRRIVRRGEQAVLGIGGQDVVRAYHRAFDPQNGDHQCSIFIEPSAAVQDWEIVLVAEDVVDGRVHAWIERDSGCLTCQSHFPEDDSDPRTTTGTIANGYRTIVVGAYDGHQADRPRARFSSIGPTRDGRDKPDLVAPGVLEIGARSTPRGGPPALPYVRMSGTSMAAPAVAGTVALMFQAAGRPLRIEETRRLLLVGCDPPAEDTDPRGLGSGYLNPERVLASLRSAPHLEATMSTPAPELSAADLFDVFTSAGPTPDSFDVVGAPDQPLGVPLRAGDLVLARPHGLPFASVSVVADPSLRTHQDLGGGRPPGRYAAVFGAPARESARLVTHLNGVVTPNTVILRPLALPIEAEDNAGIWVPGAERLPHPKSGGLPYVQTAPWRFVFHTIEGRPSVDAFRALARRHGSPPHLWAMPSANLLLQVIPLDRGAYALAHPRGTVHTNRMRAIQVECWGYARDMGDTSADVLDWLADRVLGPVAALVPLDLANVRATSGEDCYGLRSPCRMSDAEWGAFDGVCGHQHVPHNAHWDPGLLDLRSIAARAARLRGGAASRETVADAALLASDEAEAEDDAALHGASSGDAEGTERSTSARLEWVDLSTMVGPFGRPEVYYLVTGPPGGGPSQFRLKVTNTNSVKNFLNTTLKVRLRRRTEPRESAVVPLEGQGNKPWKGIRSEEIPDESARVIPIDLGAATMRRAYDPDDPQRWLDVEFHWYESDLFGYSAYYASTSRAFYLVAPVELLLQKKRFMGERALDNQAEHAARWKHLWEHTHPFPVQYKLTLQKSTSNSWGGQASVTSATTTTKGIERSQQQTLSDEVSLELGVKDMFTIGQKVGSSVTTGIQWNESIERAMTFAASQSREFTIGHSEQAEISVQIPAAPKGRKQTLYAYPVVGLWEVPVVLYRGANELGQATKRSAGTVPVVWLRGWGTRIVST